MTSQELQEEKEERKLELLDSYEFEIQQMEKVLHLMNTQKWQQVDFQLSLKNPQEWKAIISKFNFGDCIPKKYIIGMKKLCRLAFQDGINQKKIQLEQLKKKLNI